MDKNSIRDKLGTYIRREILRDNDYPLRNDEPLVTGGLIDSFHLIQMAVFIETEFNVYIPDTDLTVENMDTINDMAKHIQQKMKDE